MELPDIIDMIRPSVVVVTGPSGQQAHGTGFAITKNVVVTCRHVVDRLDGRHAGLRVYTLPDETVTVEVVNGDSGGHDLAILRTDRDLPPLSLSGTPPREGEAIAMSGFPLGIPKLVTTAGIVACVSLPQQQGAVHFVDVTINPGNSGGPAFRISDGAVIGVCSHAGLAPLHDNPNPALRQSSGLGVVIPASFVADLLRSAGIGPP